ncbi:hypothetical protein Pan241w_44570 [Gimesia alba]|uniref:Uncharacterized protein n=1 Tax=Gimesia alba TaxID=2527973 RepID=A0A517RKE0_9PLAN|nr:prealbumin-like fold domain-containing protein [Gimesia alba]QDT44348.1 hypothetical protein Pan241w_44570 [Gimesia alba]
MAWPEISIDDFPPKRDDEPSSLRQDIIDELTDHFACALNRELLKNPDEQTAKQRVLHQFGDPIKIARQLWLDAMKEKMMSQRILTGIAAVMAVCCMAVVGIAWILVQESRVVNQKLLEQMAVIAERPVAPAESQTDQQILLELKRLNQLQAMGSVAVQERMNQVSFQLVTDKNSQPATGITGRLIRLSKELDDFVVEATSDTKGKLDFGKLPAGPYALELKTPWGEIYQKLDFRMIPGREFSKTIVCPAQQPEPVSVSFQILRSEEFESDEWLVLADFRVRQIKKNDEVTHSYLSERQIENDNWFYLQPVNQGVYLIGKKRTVLKVPLRPDGKYQNLNPEIRLDQLTVDVPQGQYALPALYLIRRENLSRLSDLNENYFDPVALDRSNLIPGIPNLHLGGEMYAVGNTVFVSPFKILDKKPIKLSPGDVQRYPLQHFAASPGKKNVWNINFYDKKIAQVD